MIPEGEPKAKGLWAPCDLKAMIQRIVVAPKSAPYIEQAARAVSEAFGLGPAVVMRSAMEKGVPAYVSYTLQEVASLTRSD